MLVTADTATNFNNMHLCIPFQIKKKSNPANDVGDDLMTVNNFSVHFIQEIDIRRYSDDVRILPTINIVDIYRYSDAMLKHMPDKALKTYDETYYYTVKKLFKLAKVLTGLLKILTTQNQNVGNRKTNFMIYQTKKRYIEYL